MDSCASKCSPYWHQAWCDHHKGICPAAASFLAPQKLPFSAPIASEKGSKASSGTIRFGCLRVSRIAGACSWCLTFCFRHTYQHEEERQNTCACAQEECARCLQHLQHRKECQ